MYLRPEDEPPRDTKLDTQAQNRVVVRDVAFDPKKPNAPDTARVGVGGKKRMYAGVSLGPAATAAWGRRRGTLGYPRAAWGTLRYPRVP